MSSRGWTYVHDTYARAWRVRVESGDASGELLTEAFRRATPPNGVSGEGLPGKVLLDFWDQGVEPNRLRTEFYKGYCQTLWRGTVVPVKAIYDAFRGNRKG